MSPRARDEDETRLSAPTSGSGWTSIRDIDHGRFQPGAVLDDRYRIVGRLGRGGMGEVYRVDDLKLGQPVALKFLPESVDRDPVRLTQLHTEVRLARQGSHPHVCRVDDLKLGQPVALKFLPESVDRDPVRLTQLHTEVRLARQVSHPNVCR